MFTAPPVDKLHIYCLRGLPLMCKVENVSSLLATGQPSFARKYENFIDL